MSDILTAESGSKLYLLGNEAVRCGELSENGISVAATYPGTPSSEIGDTFMDVAKDAGMYFEFSANEKVALEVARRRRFRIEIVCVDETRWPECCLRFVHVDSVYEDQGRHGSAYCRRSFVLVVAE